MRYFLVNRFTEQVEDGSGSPPSLRRVKSEMDEDQFNSNGFHVVQVPNNVEIDETNVSSNQTNLFTYPDLLEEKYSGLLENNSQYEYKRYADLLSGNIDLNSSQTKGAAGSLNTFLIKDGGTLITDVFDISSDSPGSFSDFSVHWNVYSYSKTEYGNRTVKTYIKKDASEVDAFISNDGGTNFQKTSYMSNVPFGNTGDQVVLRFENNDPRNRHYLTDFGFFY
jgi:hypothetical protein